MQAETEIPRLLSFLFMAFGTVTDGDLAPEELELMAETLKRYLPAGSHLELIEHIEQAAALYDAHDSEDAIWASASDFARLLRDHLREPHLREAVIDDLVRLAQADGVVVAGELRFIEHVMEIFGIDRPLPIKAGPCDAYSSQRGD